MRSKGQKKLCQRRGCHGPWRRRKLCSKHYKEFLAEDQPHGRSCSEEGCTESVVAPGRCSFHQFDLYGLLKPEVLVAIEARLAGRVRPGRNGCWEWWGRQNRDEYGLFDVNFQRGVLVHRWMWMHLVGQIPIGMHLDHICVNPRCVRPGHLQPVTPAEHDAITQERRRRLAEGGGHLEWVAPDVHRSLKEAYFGIQFDLPYTLGAMTLPASLQLAAAAG